MAKLGGGGAAAESGKPTPAPRNILVICPTHRDHRELPLLCPPGTRCLFHDYASASLEDLISKTAPDGDLAADPLVEIDRILAGVSGMEIAAVISTDDYPGSALAAGVAERLGLPGPAPEIALICQHKYLSRVAQAKIVPDAVPPFALIDVAEGAALPGGLSFPLFVKPVKSFFSIGAEKIASGAELAAVLPRWAMLDQFFLPLDRMLERYAGTSIGTKRLIAEGLLKGTQVTVEGYAYGGVARIMGVVDSIMFPGTLAFSRFEYPSSLPEAVQARMADIATTLMGGLGFDNGLFNIEMMYDADADRITIIEINPRMASQFADLYEKVDGTNSYEVLLAIGQGRAPEFTPRQGRYGFAASCVLRTFADHLVASLPSEADIGRLARLYPDVRVELHATVGRKLSQELQDGQSYRYGIVNLGGRDREDVLEQFEACRKRLGIVLLPANNPGGAVPDLKIRPDAAGANA
jgi:biotin carboxylase